MAAPTPVSALVHSSTLVTAGVYLMVRFYPLLRGLVVRKVLLYSGALTMIISRLGAIYEMDLKKIIALSTLSQLGMMMTALGLGMNLIAFFHLLTHALFKASLFLCAGRVIHLYGGTQDLRKLRRVRIYIPLTYSCLVVCSFSLIGLPFISAFYSKDKIIEIAFGDGANEMCLVLLFFSVLFTSIYSLRLLLYIRSMRKDAIYEECRDSVEITRRIMLLSLGGVIGGRCLSWIVFDCRHENLKGRFKVAVLLMILYGRFVGYGTKMRFVRFIGYFFSRMWFIVGMRTKMILKFGVLYREKVMKRWDCGWNETLRAQGIKREFGYLVGIVGQGRGVDFKKVLVGILVFLVFCGLNF